MDLFVVFGYSLVLTGALSLTPQVIAIWKSKSATGLNPNIFGGFDAITTLVSVYFIKLGVDYNNWIECALASLQFTIIQLLIHYYRGRNTRAIALTIILKVVGIAALWQLSAPTLEWGLFGIFPFAVSIRLLELYAIIKNQSTGQMSFSSSVLGLYMFGGRALTGWMTGEASSMLIGRFTDTVLSIVQVSLFFVYGKIKAE